MRRRAFITLLGGAAEGLIDALRIGGPSVASSSALACPDTITKSGPPAY
jgi:hypothetical protein